MCNTNTKPLLVLKFGTSAITTPDGLLHDGIMAEIVRQIAHLHQTHRIVIVSSGAVAAGMPHLKGMEKDQKTRKAAAAIGNPLLTQKYQELFTPYGITVAQSLLEREHFRRRSKFLKLRNTFDILWDADIIPIANENDVVSGGQIKFLDNDELATLIACGFGAKELLLGTTVPGLLDEEGKLVPEIKKFDSSILGLANDETSAGGLGGMVSKLSCAHMATNMGINTVIFGAKAPGSILDALEAKTGTQCRAQMCKLSSNHRWMASGSMAQGTVTIDEGAAKAVRKRKSLLAVGITDIEGEFSEGEIFGIRIPGEDKLMAVGRAKMPSSELIEIIKNPSKSEKKGVLVSHADNMVIL